MALAFFAASVSAGGGGLEPGENENLPYFGRFYGNGLYGPYRGVGNSSLNQVITWFFWGDRNAVIDGFQIHWRYGEGYSQGNGGEYTIRIVEADPETRAPTSPRVVIAQITGYRPAQEHGFNPATQAGFVHVEKSFIQPGRITAKQPYCVEIVNTHSSPGSNYLGVNVDLQSNYFSRSGPVPYAQPPEFWNPARIVIGGQERAWWPWPIQRRGSSFSWRRLGPPLCTLRYADGIYTGWSAGLGGGSGYTLILSGNDQQRDRFRVTRASRVIDRLYVPVWRQNGTSGNFVVTLEQGPSSDTSGNGTVLEELSVPVSSLYSVGSSLNVTESSAGADDHDKVPWHEFPLSQPRTLQLGTIYNIRLRSTGNSVFLRERAGPELQGTSPKASSWAEHEQIRKLSWLEGEDSRGRQETSNGGSSWTGFASRRFGWLMRCVIE